MLVIVIKISDSLCHPLYGEGALSDVAIRPSVRLSVPCPTSKTVHFRVMITIEH